MSMPADSLQTQPLPCYRLVIRRFVPRHNAEPVMQLQLTSAGRVELAIYVECPGTASQRVSGYAALWNPALKHSNLPIDIAPYALLPILKALLGPLDFAAALAIQTARAA